MSSQERPGVVRVFGDPRSRNRARRGMSDWVPRKDAAAATALAVWDTGQASAEALASEAIQQKSGWKLLPGSETATAFQGDAVISNGHVLAIAQAGNRGRGLLAGSGQAGLSSVSGFNPWRRHRAGLAYGE